MKKILLKISYGTIFAVVLPLCLLLWVKYLDKSISLPVPEWKFIAMAGMITGGFLILKGIADLWLKGKGLPMNAFPPEKFVTGGIFAWVSHPVYTGAALLSYGAALWCRSSSGLYIVSPILTLGMVSLVYGYEKGAIQKTFGENARRYRPIISIPAKGKWRQVAVKAIIFFLTMIYLGIILFLFDFNFTGHILFTISIVAAALVLSYGYRKIWDFLRWSSEKVANSRRDWLFCGGRFRIINHSIFAGLAGALAAGMLTYVIGDMGAVLLMGFCALTGAALFAQLRWGNSSLLRPFGYWGAISGAILGIFLIWLIFDVPVYRSATAAVLCAPFTQAIGRLRCLSQGCCHGPVTSRIMGIRVWQEQSRVVILSGLKGEFILPTQIFSILFNLLLGLLLIAVWSSQRFNSQFIIGLYFILTGLERFTEDAYRGEKQTRLAMGMRENQWISVAAAVTGVIVTMLPPSPAPAPGAANPTLWYTALTGGLITAFAMGMDFPKSKIKYSRLSG